MKRNGRIGRMDERNAERKGEERRTRGGGRDGEKRETGRMKDGERKKQNIVKKQTERGMWRS